MHSSWASPGRISKKHLVAKSQPPWLTSSKLRLSGQMERTLYEDPALLHHVTATTAAVEAAETHTEMIAGANVPNVITTTTDPSSWRLGSPHPATTKTEATDGQKIDGTVEMIAGTVEMITRTVEMITDRKSVV